MAEGTVFSIEEFATFDGPGIRTTVFLKGCPLRCMWCHNPEGQLPEPQYVRSPNGCLECGACLREGQKKTGRPSLCAESVAVCPRRLVRLSGDRYSPRDLCEKLLKNADILRDSGGGVTFSGGEPLSQPEFLAECLDLLAGKLHRAIQTSGFASAKVFSEILNRCDYMLFDLKLMDSALHRRYTGVGNEQILENFQALVKSGKGVCARIPLIPSVNDTEENIVATAKFLRECGVPRIELLPYNKMAGAKYALVGRKYKVDFDGQVAPQPHLDLFEKYGIQAEVM